MNKNCYLIVLLLSSISLTLCQATDQQNECNFQVGCQCYCSELCGPRAAKEDDCPFYSQKVGAVVCQQWDEDNYVPNKCYLKPNQDFENCLGKKQIFKQPSPEEIATAVKTPR